MREGGESRYRTRYLSCVAGARLALLTVFGINYVLDSRHTWLPRTLCSAPAATRDAWKRYNGSRI